MRHAASRRLDDELDAWVLEELEAISQRVRTLQPAASDARGQRRMNRDASAPDDAGELRRLEMPPETMMPLFEDVETTFIERSAEWLRGRANADMILEEIWRLVVTGQAEERDPEQEESETREAGSQASTSDRTDEAPQDPGPEGG